MKSLIIKQTENTIKVTLDKENNIFEFIGKSFPENTTQFYKPVLSWLDEYKKNPLRSTHIHMNFIYFNTSSAKLILEIIREFNLLFKAGNEAKIVWHYLEDDYDILDAGEEYSSMVDLPFEFISFKDDDDD